ncbi:putative osa, partial [Fasciola gigantica]
FQTWSKLDQELVFVSICEASFSLRLNQIVFFCISLVFLFDHCKSIVLFVQGSTYPYAGAQGQRYTDPYGRPTYPPSSAYPYYHSPPPQSMAQPPSRQQPVSSAVISATCASSASPTQAHPMDFNSSNSGPPSRSTQSQTAVAGVHSIERPSSGVINSNSAPQSHTHPSPVHGSQMSSPLHASASNTTPVTSSTSQAPVWSSHTPQPPFGSPHQLAHGQMTSAIQSNNAGGTVSSNRPRSASRDSVMKGNVSAIDGSCELTTMHGTPQPSESDRGDSHLPTNVDEPGSRPQSRMSDCGRPPTASSTGSAGLRDHPSDETNATIASSSSGPATVTSVADSGQGASGVNQLDGALSSAAGSSFVSNPTLSPIPTTPRGTPPSHPYAMFSQTGGGSNAASPAQVGAVQPTPGRPPSQPGQSPRPYGIPPQTAVGPRQPYPSYMHPMASQQPQPHQPHPYYMVGNRPPGFYPSMGGSGGSGPTMGPGGHPSMRPSMHPMGPGVNRSGATFGSQGMMMPPPAAPPPPNSSQANLPGPVAQPAGPGFMPCGSYPGPGNGPVGPLNNATVWESHPQTGSGVPLSSVATMSQTHYSGNGGRPSPLYAGIPDRSMAYPGSPQPGAVSSAASVPSHSSPHTQSSMAPAGYPHPHSHTPNQPPTSYPIHAPPHMAYPSAQIPYGGGAGSSATGGTGGGAPHPSAHHAYVSGMSPSSGTGTTVPPYATGTGMVPLPGSNAQGQHGREHSQSQQSQIHSPYTNDMVPSTDRGAPPFCSVPASSGITGTDPPTYSTSIPGIPSPAGVARGVPISGVGTSKLPPGAGLGKVSKMDGSVRSMTPNSTGPNASPHLGVGAIGGVMDESGPAPSSVPTHQQLHHHQQPPPPSSASLLPQSCSNTPPGVGPQQQHQAQPSCVMPPTGQSGMQPFPGSGGQSGYWCEAGAPNQFPGGMSQTGMIGSQNPHNFPSFQQHYRMHGSGAPAQPPPSQTPGPQQPSSQGMPVQHAHNIPNSIHCPTSVSGPTMYGSGLSPYGNAHAHAHPVGHSVISAQSSSVFHRLLEMGTEPERRAWLEHYVRFMEEIGKPLVGLPQVVKQPLDLYRFYLAVRERGGVLDVIKARRWKEISQLVNINASASAAYTLRKNYCKFLLDYECRFDRGGADPNPLLAHIEAMSGKKKKPSSLDESSTTLSASGHSLSAQAPPSPAGSHSSASSSLLPPGSGSASLSGVPSGTAGSAASDSQLGPSASQSRFGDPSVQLSNSAVGESPNGMIGSPGSGVLTAHGANSGIGSASFNQSSAQSPQRPPSATLNGYPNTPHAPPESVSRSNIAWPWISESGVPGSHPPPIVSVNGFSASMSPIRGPLSVHGLQHGFDPCSRSNTNISIPSPKNAQTRALTPGQNVTSMPQPVRSPIPVGIPSSAPSSMGLPSSSPNVIAGMKASDVPTPQQPQQPPPHHSLVGHYAPPGGPPQPQNPTQSQMPSTHASIMGPQQQHPNSPVHSSMTPHGIPGPPPPGSPMHPRLTGGPGIRGPPFGSGPPGVSSTHNLGASSNESLALLRMHNIRPPAGGGPSPGGAVYPSNVIPPFHPGQPNSAAPTIPAHLVHHHGQRPGYVATILKRVEHYPFPPGSIEATQIEPSRRRRYRIKDIGVVSPFKLLMALRSGLTAEVSWALNCLNILLRDESGLENFTGGSLNALITNLAELWRHSLGELFDHNLFVCSLELPTNIASFGRSLSSGDKCASDLARTRRESKLLSCPAQSVTLTASKKCSSFSSLPNGLATLERDLVALANIRGVPIASLRDGIRRMLRKCGNPIGEFIPVRARNGLLLNSASATGGLYTGSGYGSTSTSVVSHSITALIDPNHPGSRTRKRGSKQLGSGYGYAPFGLGSTTTATGMTSSSTNILSQTISSALKSENVPPSGIATRVATAPNSLRSPLAYTNLRELALFVIDELLSQAKPTHQFRSDGEDENEIDENELRSQSPAPNTCKLDSDHLSVPNINSCWSVSAYLRDLIQHGGGDTTCHIMPPFGAAPYPSKHWRGNPNHEDPVSIEPVVLAGKISLTPPPPPEVGEEKCSLRGGDLMDCELPEDDEGIDSQMRTKRARHSSSSSLPCPVLSPQPVEESQDDSEVKLISRQTAGSKSVAGNTCSPAERFLDSSDTPADVQNESEFSQLLMDANGRCPLRAREELVHHGPSCLWPDHPQANSNEARAVRCLCVSTVLRNLSFWHLAEFPLSSHKPTLALIGRVIMLGHEHVGTDDTWQSVEEAAKRMEPSQCAWRTPSWLDDMRENALVLLVNLAGYLDLIRYEESIVRPILEGLLHWIVCPTAVAIDPFPGHRTLSPRRLALEALNRLCVHESNVDLLLSTPGSRESDLHLLFGRLAHWLALPEDQVTRELALSTMHYLTGGGVSFSTLSEPTTSKSRGTVASSMQISPTSFVGTTLLSSAKPCPVSGLLSFIEMAEATTRRVIDQCGVQALQERPELMGTSLEMVRRAGALLDRLAADPTGRTRFTPTLELRLLDLVTSRVLDATVAHLLCGALHRLSLNRPTLGPDTNPPTVTPLVPPIPTLSVVAKLLQTAATPTKSETVAHSVPLEALKSTTTENRQSITSNTESSLKSATPTSEKNQARSEDTTEEQKRKGSLNSSTEDQLPTKDTALPLTELVNHVDSPQCHVPLKKECGPEIMEVAESKSEHKELLLVSNSVESSTWNSNCVDSS